MSQQPPDDQFDSPVYTATEAEAAALQGPPNRPTIRAQLLPTPHKVHLLWYREDVVAGRCEQIVGVFWDKIAAHKEVERICASAKATGDFFSSSGWPKPDKIRPENFSVEAHQLMDMSLPPRHRRQCAICGQINHDDYMLTDDIWKEMGMTPNQEAHLHCLPRIPKLEDFTDARINDAIRFGFQLAENCLPPIDDWELGVPDSWKYETVLRDNEVAVEWDDQMTSNGETFTKAPPDLCGWGFHWQHGAIHIGRTTETIARKAAALFVSLWLRGVSASFCDKLMNGYIIILERQEDMSLTFLAEIDPYGGRFDEPAFYLTREGFCKRESLSFLESVIAETLNPGLDEEVIVTFSKRKKR